jgi:ketosteroid isomerase-like protein
MGHSESVTSPIGNDNHQLLANMYAAFNRRDVNAVLAAMRPDVVWPNGWEGGTVLGHDQVREYWRHQWGELDPTVVPTAYTDRSDGRTAVTVHQVVRDKQGALLTDQQLVHIYRFVHGLVSDMEIRQVSG